MSSDIDDRFAKAAGQRNAVDAQLVSLVAELLDSGEWEGRGVRSASHWLTVHLGCTPTFAHRLVRIAQRRCELPEIFAAFDGGRLSLDIVELAATRGPSWADPQLLDLAEYATVTQFRRELAVVAPHGIDTPIPGADPNAELDHPTPDDPDVPPGSAEVPVPASGQPVDYFSYGWTSDGRFRGSFDLDAATGIIVEAALDERRDAHFNNGSSTATAVDAITDIATRSLNATSSARRNRHTCMVHLNIAGGGSDLIAQLSNGAPLPRTVTDYLTCDTTLRPIWFDDSTPLGAGTDQRTVPTDLRRIIQHRDQGCRVPGCGHTKHLDIHHITHWSNGGPTESWNLVTLCTQHHRMHHQHRLHLSGDPNKPGALVFTDETGTPLATGPAPKPPGHLPEPARPYVHPTGERLRISDVPQLSAPHTLPPRRLHADTRTV